MINVTEYDKWFVYPPFRLESAGFRFILTSQRFGRVFSLSEHALNCLLGDIQLQL